MTYHDHVSDFINFMASNGVEPMENIAGQLAGGNLVRFQCRGDAKGRKNGWAMLHLDERPVGKFGNWKQNTGTLTWKANSDAPALSAEEREALQREWNENRQRREEQRLDAARQASYDAADIWQRSVKASRDHPYVKAKALRTLGLRQDGDRLIIPMFDAEGTLWNLQRIYPDGTKLFLKGGRIEDCFAIIGDMIDADEIVICEGYSTGDAINQASGLPVIVAFNTSNLSRVCRVWADRRPDLTITVYADDDHGTGLKYVDEGKPYKNPGIEAAQAAAAEIGAKIAYPHSYHERQRGAA